MKQLILLILLCPLISFGQKTEIKSNNKKNPWVYENGDNKRETYWNLYNNVESNTKIIHYHKEEKHSEVSFKGFIYETHDSTFSDGKVRKVTSQNPIRDGFSREWNSKGLPCSERFYIYGKCIYEGEDCHNSWLNALAFGVGDSYNPSREFDLEFMINLFLDDIINNNLEKGEPSSLIKKIRLKRKSQIDGIKINATFTTLEKGVLALSSGYKDDKNIILKVDPENWLKASIAKRWYTLYHELGHDVLNFEHGQGGKMMFNISNEEYTWNEFNDNRNYMFEVFLKSIN